MVCQVNWDQWEGDKDENFQMINWSDALTNLKSPMLWIWGNEGITTTWWVKGDGDKLAFFMYGDLPKV